MSDERKYGTFIVEAACSSEDDPNYIEPFPLRLALNTEVMQVKEMIVNASQKTITPMDRDFAEKMKLTLNGTRFMHDFHRLNDYEIEPDPTFPKSYMGVLFVTNNVIGAIMN
mmetsp:Transcript_5949/g.9289  ORF Transcript_5949/g.9289 Transcript_5949/m.9289 type:complete len:112 (-) Transcript_5949:151-486(-)